MQDDIVKILYSLIKNAPIIYFPIALLGGILLLTVKSIFSSSFSTIQIEKSIRIVNYLNQNSIDDTKAIKPVTKVILKARKCITKGKIELGIEEFGEIKELLSNDANNFIELISSQLYSEKTNFNKGIISSSDFSSTWSRISISLLDFITKLEKEIVEFEKEEDEKDKNHSGDEYQIPISNKSNRNIFKNWHQKNFRYQVYFLTTLILLVVTSLCLLYYYTEFEKYQSNSNLYFLQNFSYRLKNDSLSNQIDNLNNYIRINEEQLRTNEERLRINQEQLSEISTKLVSDVPFEIEQIIFFNKDTSKLEENWEEGYGFDKDSVRYITPKINIIPKIQTDKICIYLSKPYVCKYWYYIKSKIHRKGALEYNSTQSPIGYTYQESIGINKSTREVTLSGWGNPIESTYDEGVYTFEIYYRETLIGKEYFRIY